MFNSNFFFRLLFFLFRSLRPLYVALVDPDSTQNLRQNREKLSQEITKIINDYGPKVFGDFDPDNVFRSDPSGSRESVSELGEGGKTFSQILASRFFNNKKALDWLDDRNIFNLTKQEEEEEDVLHFLDKHSGMISGGSASEPEMITKRNGKRTRKMAGMTCTVTPDKSNDSEKLGEKNSKKDQ